MEKKTEIIKTRMKKKSKEKARLLAAEKKVKKANEIKDPLDDFPAFRNFSKNELKVSLECWNVNDLTEFAFQEIFNLEKENMESIYNSCSWGWDEEKKYKEMTEDAAKYLIAKDDTNQIVGFSHFRFDTDFGDEVLYCYELQLSSKVRRKGLGKFLLQVLELIAFKNNMRKVVLTVLKHNTNAVCFFRSMRYEIDETNPEGIFKEEVPYQILSKINKRLLL